MVTLNRPGGVRMHNGRGKPGPSPVSAQEYKIDVNDASAVEKVTCALVEFGLALRDPSEPLILLCVGTDRSTGDALGPLVGTIVTETPGLPFAVYGTLDNPVHASNLKETMDWLSVKHRKPLVIAVDACLGRLDSVGTITVGKGPLRPGAGVNKTLPQVGQIYVTGVVNVGGFMEYFVLQNTRLNLVMRMAKVIAQGLSEGCRRLLTASDTAFPARQGTTISSGP